MASYDNIFKIRHNMTLPAQGDLLISEPFLHDAYFQRSVVLLVEHAEQGSMGLVLNKKTSLLVNSFFKELEECADIPIYFGGPVGTNRLFFLHTLGEEIIPGSIKVSDQLYFDGDFEAMKRYLANGHDIRGKVKFFLGYAGWTEGQLSEEISQDSWVVGKPLSNEDVLSAEDESYWKSSVSSLGKSYRNWTRYPKDPAMN